MTVFKPLLFFLGLLLSYGTVLAQNNYSIQFGTSSNDLLRDGVIDPSDGSMYTCGRSSDNLPMLAKVDDCGVLVFDLEYSYPGLTLFRSMTPTRDAGGALDGGYLLTDQTSSGDWFLMRVDVNGDVIWANLYHAGLERNPRIISSIGDTYILTGWHAGTGISDDATMIRINGSGGIIWTRRLDNVDDQAYDATPNGSGGCIITGGLHSNGVDMFIAEVDVNGNFVQGREIHHPEGGSQPNGFYENASVTRTADGGYAICGRSAGLNVAHNWVYTAVKKLDANFNTVWERDYFTGVSNFAQTISATTDGNLAVGTISNWSGANETTLMTLDANNGNILEARAMPGINAMFLRSDEAPYPKVYAFGQTNVGPIGNQDATLISMDFTLNSCLAGPVVTSENPLPYVSVPWNPVNTTRSFTVTDVTDDVEYEDVGFAAVYACGGCTGDCDSIFIDAQMCHTVYYGYDPAACADLDILGIAGGDAPYTIEWSTGETTPSINVCPSTDTDYTVTVFDANGCEGTLTIRVKVVDVRGPCLNNNGNNGGGNPNHKVLVCHHTNSINNPTVEICVDQNAVPMHINNHGDHLGPCGLVDPCTGELRSAMGDGHIHEEHVHATTLDVFPTALHAGSPIALRFTLASDETASIRLYDLSGQEIMVIADRMVGTETEQTLSINTSKLRAGLYLVKLASSDEVLTRRLVITK